MCHGFEVEDPGAGGVPSPLPATSSSIHSLSPAPLSPHLSSAKKFSNLFVLPWYSLQGCQDRVLLRACQGDDLGREEQRLLKLLRKRLSHYRSEVTHNAIMDRDTIQHHVGSPLCGGGHQR